MFPQREDCVSFDGLVQLPEQVLVNRRRTDADMKNIAVPQLDIKLQDEVMMITFSS